MSDKKTEEDVIFNLPNRRKSIGFFYPQTRNSIIVDSIISGGSTSIINTHDTSTSLILKQRKTEEGFLPFVKERDHLGRLIRPNVILQDIKLYN